MKGIKFFIGFLILFFCFALQNVFGFSPNQNYLLGMTVTRVGSGGYFVRIKLNEDTDTQYKLKNLGENSYVLVLPHMRTKITGEDVFYENDDENIKVVISETQNHINHEDYYTKINFKTKNDTSIKIEYFARKYSKPPVVMDTTNNDIIKSAHETTIPEWFWFLPIGILSAICLIFLAKPTASSLKNAAVSRKLDTTKQPTKSMENIFDEDIEQENDDSNNEELESDFENWDIHKDKDLNKTIDELVKIIIPIDDLILMPGVPELPLLDKIKPEQNLTKEQVLTAPIIPEKKSNKQLLYNNALIEEVDNIIINEKNAFFDNIFPIQEIPKITNLNGKIKDIDEDKDFVDLISNYAQTLKFAHKVTDDTDFEPELIDAFPIRDNAGIVLVKYGQKASLVGNIGSKLFVLKTFESSNVFKDSLYVEYCSRFQNYDTFAVILTDFKALINVSKDDIVLVGEYD